MDQDPGAFDDKFATTVRSVYELRYSLLPLLYTLFAESHMTGEPVARAMFYQYVILVLSFSEVNMWNSWLSKVVNYMFGGRSILCFYQKTCYHILTNENKFIDRFSKQIWEIQQLNLGKYTLSWKLLHAYKWVSILVNITTVYKYLSEID